MSDSERIRLALEFATKKHAGQKRVGGKDYITHPVAVCEMIKEQGYGEDYQLAAIFHDLLEDTDATEEEILSLSSETVLTAVKLLTKEKGYDMQSYVGAIKNNPIAFVVKGADRLHNLRCALVTSEAFKRKYVIETVEWYLDFSSEIKVAVKNLAESMENPVSELSFLYA